MLAWGLVLIWTSSGAVGLADPPSDPPAAPAVVVELFTSEGCSSCPPADAALARLVAEQPVEGVRIIGLSEHVDYWDRLGWKDPFSARRFSDRQRRYAAAVFEGDRIYTPQMIVDGRTECVAGDLEAARRAVARAARERKVGVRAAVRGVAGAEVSIDILVERRGVGGGAAEVWLAVTEDDLRSEVRRGENSGRTLRHAAVVRSLDVVGRLAREKDARLAVTRAVRLAPAWKPGDVRAVVFVQERGTMRMLGAAIVNLSGGSGS